MKKRTLQKEKQQIINIVTTILIVIIWSILLSFPYRLSALRLATSFKDAGVEIGNQFIQYINKSKLLPDYVDKVTDYSKYLNKKLKRQNELNKEGSRLRNNTLKEKSREYWKKWLDKENIVNYSFMYLVYLTYAMQLIMLIVIIILLLKIILKEYFKRIRVAPNEKTRELIVYQEIEKTLFKRIRNTIKGYINYVLSNKWLKYSYILMFLISSNLLTIFIEFFAVYFKIFRTMGFNKMPLYIYKLLYDLKIYFKSVPVIVHIILSIYLFNYFRKKIAIQRLMLYENRNAGLVNNLPICTMLVGTMGTKKTTILTDMSLTLTNNFKSRALEDLLEIRKQYPNFNFSKLDAFLKVCIVYHQIFSLKSIDELWDKKIQRAYKKEEPRMFDERLLDLGEFANGLSRADIESSFRTYAKLFLVYYLNSALIYSNYAIRYDFQYTDVGNFPIYINNFFNSPEYSMSEEEISTYGHVLDFDMLRLGKKLIEDSESSKVYDFGFFALTEIGKERGNQLTTQGKKRTDEDTNQKNDYFNSFVKLIRHTSTINNYPYCKFFADEQRPESLEADLRELFDVVKIKRSDKYKCVYPIYFERFFIVLINEIYDRYNLDRIYYRSNDSLKYYLIRKIVSYLYSINERILNKYGVYQCELESESSVGEKKEYNYYLMLKKIYSNRFKTDAYNSFFKTSRSEIAGIGDIPQYESTQATQAELLAQNSYFIRDLQKYNRNEDERAK